MSLTERLPGGGVLDLGWGLERMAALEFRSRSPGRWKLPIPW